NTIMKGVMPCYGDPSTLDDIRKMFGYVFDPASPKGGGLPLLDLRPVVGPFSVGDLAVQPVPVWHGRKPILGLRFGALAYLTDCSALADEAWPLLGRLDVLVLDALRVRPHPMH